jgi:hypothetical protein
VGVRKNRENEEIITCEMAKGRYLDETAQFGGGLRERRSQKAPFFWECEAPKERKKGTTRSSVLVEDAGRLFGLNFRMKCKADGVRCGTSVLDLLTGGATGSRLRSRRALFRCVIASKTF